jgi:serine/threonine protein kinase
VNEAWVAAPKVEGFGPLERVGRGGFASVYRAEDEHIGREVAIKVLEHVDTVDARARDRFLRETRAMGRLSGVPHVVDIYQATFTTDGQPCIVMPFFAGGSLEDRLAAAGPLAAGSALAVGVIIGRAVDAAHRRGLSHRDLKPGNILVDERGDVALADFGIAVVEDAAASQRTRTALSPEHAAPERLVTPADGPAPEPSGDQFSLASTLYMLLTGRPPFGLVAEIGLHEVLRRIVEAPAPPIGRAEVPEVVDTVLARALAKHPEARYPSVSAFADALLAAGIPLADPPVSPPVITAVPPPADRAGVPDALTTRSRTPMTDWSATPPSHRRVTPPDDPGPGPPFGGGETIVPEHRRRPSTGAPAGDQARPRPSPARGVLLIATAGLLLAAAVGGAGAILLRGRSGLATAPTTLAVTVPTVPDPDREPPGSVPVGTTVPAGAAVARPRIESVQPVDRGLYVFWKDDGVRDAKGYAYVVTVDGSRTPPGNVSRRELAPQMSEQITAVDRDGRREPIDAGAHEYCVVIRRLQIGGAVDSEPSCTGRRPAGY